MHPGARRLRAVRHAGVVPLTETSLDHLVVGVPSLDEGVAWLAEATGVQAGGGGRHPGWGTHNALASLGDGAYLELIARDPTAVGVGPLPFGLASVHEAPRLLGWALRTLHLDATVASARAAGHDPGEPVPMQRRTQDGCVLSWRLTPPSAAGGPVPFLIDWGDTPHPSTTTPTGLSLTRLGLVDPEPAALRRRLRALGVVDVPVTTGPVPGVEAAVQGPRGELALD